MAKARAGGSGTGVRSRPLAARMPVAGRAALHAGLALALRDVSAGRAELRAAQVAFDVHGDSAGSLLAAAAQLVFIGIADDDYTGFEPATAVVMKHADALDGWMNEPDHHLLASAGILIAGWFSGLDQPGLSARAEAIVRALGNDAIAPPVRCAAGLAALGYYDARMNLEGVLWLELAMRPLWASPAAVGPRLADEAFHMFVQALYQCEAAPRALALRAHRGQQSPAPMPAIELKLQLLDAQMALGAGQADAGRSALARAEPLLHPRSPRPASWWHLLRSRLDLLEGRHRQALTHARLALRLCTESRLPERWMGVTIMQEGHVLMATGDFAAAVPFFERAGHAASGSQAQFCWCLAHLARALDHFGAERGDAGRQALAEGLALARSLNWLNFLRAGPQVAAQVCALALEHDVEAAFAREVIAERGLQAVRQDLSAWPWPIRVRTLGGLRIELDGHNLAFKGKVARKPLELLLFVIASSGSDVSVSTAAFALWRDLEGDKARAALNVALHRLRKLLGNDDAVLLELGRISLNPRLMWVDCLAFEQLADSVGAAVPDALGASARAAAERALALYTGAFMHDSEDEAWQLVYRSRLASKFMRVVTLLSRAAISRADAAAARSWLARGLELDPLAEDLARDLIRVLLDQQEPAAALAVFDRCREAIARGLAVEASPATWALVAPLRRQPPNPWEGKVRPSNR